MSPGFKYSGGVRVKPTPEGVPVQIRSPGSSVITLETDNFQSFINKNYVTHFFYLMTNDVIRKSINFST